LGVLVGVVWVAAVVAVAVVEDIDAGTDSDEEFSPRVQKVYYITLLEYTLHVYDVLRSSLNRTHTNAPLPSFVSHPVTLLQSNARSKSLARRRHVAWR
jgi:hypothetical protein